jgi:hypothetical protein
VLLHKHQAVLFARQRHALITCEDFMPAMLFVPLGERSRHVHLLDNVPPTHTSVVSAERNLTLLCCVRDDALLRAPEIVAFLLMPKHLSNFAIRSLSLKCVGALNGS